MTKSILMAYACSYGATLEVAQFVIDTLQGIGLEVELQLAKQVKILSSYDAVVLGAPLYMFHWHADAKHFLVKHRNALASLPVVIFALGPFHNKEEELRSAREQLDKELANFSWLKPVAITVFPGKFDPAKLRFPYNLIGPLKKMPPSDERNWDEIRAWVVGLGNELKARG